MGQTFTHNSCAEWKEIWQSLCLGGPETRLATVGCLPVTASDSWVPHPPRTGPSRYKLHFTSAYINISTGNQAIVLSPGCSITTTSRRGSSNSDNRFLADVKNSWGSPHIFLQFLSPEKAALLMNFDLTSPGYKWLVMEEKDDKGTNVGKFWKSPLKSIIWSFIHSEVVHGPDQGHQQP